jgi:hypothetical protein
MASRRSVIFFGLFLTIFCPAKAAVALLHCPEGMSLVPAGNTAVVYSGERWGGFVTEIEWVDDFCIDIYEASQPDATVDYSGSWAQGQPIPPAQSKVNVMPWNIISWLDAKQACAAAGKRMPTLAEWQTAYSGYDGAWWPWGTNDYDEGLASSCWINQPYMMVLPTGGCCFENCSGDQCFTTCDMLGNIAEYADGYWDETCYGETEVLIAGAGIIGWYQPNHQVEDPDNPGCWLFVIFAQRRFGLHHHDQNANLGDDGFRCASEPLDDDTVDDDTSDDDLTDDDTTDDDLADDDADNDSTDDDSLDDDADDDADDDTDDDTQTDDDAGGGQSDDDDRGCGC